MRGLLAILLLLGCGSPHSAARPVRPQGSTRGPDLDGIVRRTLAEEPTPGLAVVALRGDSTLLAKAYGEANRETHLPMAHDTPMRIGSVTKLFTAVAIMQLVTAGRLALGDPITAYLDLPAHGHRISIRDLLGQRSGLPNYVDLIHKLDGNFDRTTAQIFALIRDAEPAFEPGTQDRYSNTNYYVLGLLVEKLSGQPLGDYLRGHVTGLAGPTTTLCASAPACGYDVSATGFAPEAPVSIAAGFASGGMCSTALELSRWLRALFGGRIVSPTTLNTMITVSPLPDGSHADDGFGVAVYDTYGHRKINKSGAIAGFAASATYLPDADLILVVLANTCCASVNLVDARLTRAVLSAPSDVPIPAADAARLAGRWIRVTPTERPASPMRASVHGSHLRFTFEDGFTWHYRHVGALAFENELAPAITMRLTPAGLELVDLKGRHLVYHHLGD